jgi:hypothetical protein
VIAVGPIIAGATAVGGGAVLIPTAAPILGAVGIPVSLALAVLATTESLLAPVRTARSGDARGAGAGGRPKPIGGRMSRALLPTIAVGLGFLLSLAPPIRLANHVGMLEDAEIVRRYLDRERDSE